MTASLARGVVRPTGNRSGEAETPHGALQFPTRDGVRGPLTRARQARSLALYAGAFVLASGLIAAGARAELTALGLGLMLPGGGFLVSAAPGTPTQLVAIGLFAGSLAAFLAAVAIWFATGNAVLPPAVWLLAALGAAGFTVIHPDVVPEGVWQLAVQVVPLGAVSALGLAVGVAFLAGRRGLRRRARLNTYLQSVDTNARPAREPSAPAGQELGRQDLQLLRLLLDRALQPVESFEGLEWIDQFQTAAVRYQLNFMSYALSIAQAVHLPAFQGYFRDAQRNLLVKQQSHRIWRYWKLENAWGNLRLGADPIPRDNVMFSGFLAAQIAYFQAASGTRAFDAPGSLAFAHPSGARYAYSLPALIDVLVRGYGESDFGLLACEPNWIYPLCNAITASAIRACDAANGTSRWDGIADAFRHRLESEFITAGGRFVPFRSSYTGFAAPPMGLAVMQAFPCFFLNAVLPDIALRQWLMLRRDLAGRCWRRASWPVDVGNYRFSRASSYAATAAAAVELGDTEVAKHLLQLLDEDCPLRVSVNVAHRPNASLWAHAVELVARCGRAGALRSLATVPRQSPAAGPVIRQAPYPQVLVARAVNQDGCLSAVLYPGTGPGSQTLTLGGLAPHRNYVAETDAETRFTADAAGEARLEVRLAGRTELRVTPTA